MRTRILPRTEWDRLVGTEAETLDAILPDGQGEVVVVEDAGQIVGCWALVRVVHAECVWIAPNHRSRGSVARRLLRGMRSVARAMGTRAVVTAALAEDVDRLLVRIHAQPLPGRHYVVPIPAEGGTLCQHQ